MILNFIGHLKKDIEIFMIGIKDPVQDLLDYKKIMCFNFLINEKDKSEEFVILENVKNFFEKFEYDFEKNRRICVHYSF